MKYKGMGCIKEEPEGDGRLCFTDVHTEGNITEFMNIEIFWRKMNAEGWMLKSENFIML